MKNKLSKYFDITGKDEDDKLGEKITDEGVAALARLRKLEELEFWYMKGIVITRNAVENYTSLKAFQWWQMERNMKEIAYTLIENCKNMEKLKLYGHFTKEEIINFLLYVAFAFRMRNNYFPLTVYLSRLTVRILLIKSEINSEDKILFEIYKRDYSSYAKKGKPVFSTNDLDTFMNELVSLYFKS